MKISTKIGGFMNRNLALIGAFHLAFSLGGNAQTGTTAPDSIHVEYNDDDELRIESPFKNGVKEGLEVAYQNEERRRRRSLSAYIDETENGSVFKQPKRVRMERKQDESS
jgi:hypothetical protein